MGTIRTIQTDELVNVVKEMCIKVNHFLAPDMDRAMKDALESERSPLGKQILSQLQDNLRIAGEEMIPICQDTGMAVLFVEIGQDVHFEGMLLEDALNEGVRRGYTEGFLRKSVVSDPLLRVNTKDNTPAIIHYFMVAGEDYLCPKRIRQRKHESCIYAETRRRGRGSQKSYLNCCG